MPPAIDENFGTILEWADALRRLRVRANADTPADAAKAREFGAEGIGLCRTEHMFMGEDRLPVVREMILARDEDERRGVLERLLPMQQAGPATARSRSSSCARRLGSDVSKEPVGYITPVPGAPMADVLTVVGCASPGGPHHRLTFSLDSIGGVGKYSNGSTDYVTPQGEAWWSEPGDNGTNVAVTKPGCGGDRGGAPALPLPGRRQRHRPQGHLPRLSCARRHLLRALIAGGLAGGARRGFPRYFLFPDFWRRMPEARPEATDRHWHPERAPALRGRSG